MDETERERSRREKSAFYDDVLERLTAMGITDLKTRADIAEREWYMFTLNCEYYERERFKRHREREQQREIERECLRLMDEEEAARHVETPSADHDEKQESATDHDQQPEDEKRDDGGAELGTDASEGDGDEPESETTESLDLLREIDEMLSDATGIIRTAAKNAIPRLKTGIPSLDEKLGGGLAAGVHVLMAPPSEGKTAFSLSMCLKARGEPSNKWSADDLVIYWGLDTSESDVWARLASCISVLKGNELGIEPFAYNDVPNDKLIRLNQLTNAVERYRKNHASHKRELRECLKAIKEIMDGTVGDYLTARKEAENTMYMDDFGFRFFRPTDSSRNEISDILDGDFRPAICENHYQMLENLLDLRPYVDEYGDKDMDTAREMLKGYCSYEELEKNHLIGNRPQGDEVELLLSYLYTWDDIRLCVVDYLQLLKIAPKNGGGTPQERIDRRIELLSNAAMEKRIPIIVISSMSKEAIRSSNPDMMNASGSSTLQYKAETITEMRTRKKEQGVNTVELHIEKNRGRKPCTLRLNYMPAYNCFAEVKEAEQEDAGTAREGR